MFVMVGPIAPLTSNLCKIILPPSGATEHRFSQRRPYPRMYECEAASGDVELL